MIIIAALTKDRVIGKDNALLWRIPEDLKNFKRLTSGNTVIMGRKTFEAIGRPLPDRNNIVMSSSMDETEGVDVCEGVDAAIEKAESYGKDIFIIGGEQIYRLFYHLADKMYLSWVKKDYEGDAYFPEFNPADWKEVSRENHEEYEFVVYKRFATP